MIGPTGNVRVYLACGVTDMRRGIDGLSAMVEAVIKEAPGSGAIFGFRGKRADRIKLLWWDGQGLKAIFYRDIRGKTLVLSLQIGYVFGHESTAAGQSGRAIGIARARR